MGRKIDISGQRFGRLVAICDSGKRSYGAVLWRCLCDCGNETLARYYELKSGHVQSCGCLANQIARTQTYRRQNLTGLRFGRLVVSEPAGKNKNNQMRWRCICDCGRSHVADASNLKSGNVTSCGCLAREVHSQRLVTHHGSREQLYRVWINIKERCFNPAHKSYKDYGGRGITLCPEWMEYDQFRRFALSNGWSPGLQVNRIDNDKGYCPENVNFVTPKENSNNRRSSVVIDWDGRSMTLAELSRLTGVSYPAIWGRYKRGKRGKDLVN